MQLRFSQKDEELQKEINELRTNLAQIDQSLKMRKRIVAENKDKITEIGRKLAGLGSGGSALEALQKELTSTVRHAVFHTLIKCLHLPKFSPFFLQGT